MFGMWRISIKQLVEYRVNAKSFPQLRLCHAACGDLSAVNLFQRLARSDIDVVSSPLSKEKCTESGLVAMKNAQKKREQVPPF